MRKSTSRTSALHQSEQHWILTHKFVEFIYFKKSIPIATGKGFVRSTMTVTTIQKLASEVALDKIQYVYMSCGS